MTNNFFKKNLYNKIHIEEVSNGFILTEYEEYESFNSSIKNLKTEYRKVKTLIEIEHGKKSKAQCFFELCCLISEKYSINLSGYADEWVYHIVAPGQDREDYPKALDKLRFPEDS